MRLTASPDTIANAASSFQAGMGSARYQADAPRPNTGTIHAATGMSPIRFLQQLRMERAIEMLETTSLPFEEVAYRVGYRDPSTLRAVIRQRLGVGPRELRHRARSASAAKSVRGRSEAA